jgi:hypothetical protein
MNKKDVIFLRVSIYIYHISHIGTAYMYEAIVCSLVDGQNTNKFGGYHLLFI